MISALRLRACFLGVIFLFSSAAFALTPENGWWWNPAEPGRGFNIETQDRTVFVATFIYDEAGNPVWYSGSGELNEGGAVTVPALRFEGGQCIGCPFQEAQVTGDFGPLTLQFTSEMAAVVQWAGATVPIERFNFKLGNSFQRLLGEWLLVIGAPASPPYDGDRVVFGEVVMEEGQQFVAGHRTGDPEHGFIAIPLEAEGGNEVVFFAWSVTPDNIMRPFLFRMAGLNAVEGITTPNEGFAAPEEGIDFEQIVEDLSTTGVPFFGKRNLGATDVGAVPLDAVASPLSSVSKAALSADSGNNEGDYPSFHLKIPVDADSVLSIGEERLVKIIKEVATD
jgi:hypothetical protein